MSSLETYHPLPLTIAVLLFFISVSTLGITSHTIWLLAQYFPPGAWYIWREQSDMYEEQQTRQQWIAVDYNDTTDRLALVRAVLGAAAGLLGICVSRVRRRSVVEDEIKSKASYIIAVTFAIASFASTLTCAIWSTILHHQSSERCRVPTFLSEYNNKYTCTRELAACVMLPVITNRDDGVRKQACDETVSIGFKKA
ncbi:hypothetical protein IG631_08625 [Alternaria alternata]|nr:hypothetical protein IG631_08625 [Alternaria alternata]